MAREFLTNINMAGNRIIGLPAPVGSDEPARLSDLNSAIEGLSWKDAVRVATTANINLTAPGASINGISMNPNDRFLAKDQTVAADNGIYIWNGASTPATRSMDANTYDELEQATVSVEEGTSAGTTFRQTGVNGTLGTTAVNFTTFGVAAAAATETIAGVAQIATQAEVDAGVIDTDIVSPAKLANWAGRKQKFTATVGDGSATSFNIDHNFNTRDVTVGTYKNSGNYDEVIVDISRPSVNRITVTFGSAPAASAIRVVIMG